MEVYDKDGNIVNNVDQVLDKWKDDFSSLFKGKDTFDAQFLQTVKERVMKYESERDDIVRNHGNGNIDVNTMNRDITVEEIKIAVCKLKQGKAVGIDLIPTEVLKCNPFYPYMVKLFNICFKHGIIPSAWQKGIINPIPKSGDKDPRIPLNYRGITLTSHMYKIYCTVLKIRLNAYLERNKILVEEQNGFRKMRSCLDHIFTLVSTIENRYKRRQSTFVCFVDMQKAFDTVHHTCLLDKLRSIGICGNMYLAIKTLYEGVSSSVRINGHYTEWFDVESGVKQGCILSPSLFSIFINDLAVEIKDLRLGIDIDDYKLSILMFADDIALIADTPESLQSMLDVVSAWCHRWRLCINADKTKVVHFRIPSVQRTGFQFNCSNSVIEVTNSYKYLGMTLNEHLDKSLVAKSFAKSANRALGLLIAKHIAFGGMPHNVFTKLYDSLVAPVIEYAVAIWGHRDYSCISAVQNRACRFFMGLSKFAPNSAANGDMGWKSSLHRQRVCIVRAWLRFINMDTDRLASKVFWYSYRTAQSGCKNWCYFTMNMFNQLGIGQFTNRENCHSKTAVLEHVNNCMELETQQEWHKNLYRNVNVGGNKLRTYRKFKHEYKTEMYLKRPMSFKVRRSFSNLRCGTAPLRIETGRYEGKALEERICQCCDSNNIEDEMHFLIKCNAFKEERKILYAKVTQCVPDFNQLHDEDKFLVLMSNDDICKLTASSCHNMMMQRRSILYER